MVSTLQYPITADDLEIAVSGVDPSIIAMLQNGGHGFFRLYTAGGSEIVLAKGYVAPYIILSRNENAGAWPAGTFVSVDEISPLPLPASEDSELAELFHRLRAGPGLLRTQLDPETLQFDLPLTGVVAGAYGGMQVDQYGRIVYIPANWPTNALPVFAPGDASPSGGAVIASAVGYTPQPSARIALATDLQDAVEQLEDAIIAIQDAGGSSVVTTVSPGPGILVGGALSQPVISLATTGITPGTYEGFSVDQYGRITNFVAPAFASQIFAATLPITVAYSSISNTYTYGINAATSTTFGSVKLTDTAQAAAGTVGDPTTVPNWTAVISAIALYTAPGAPVFSDIAQNDKFSFYDVSQAKMVTATIANLFAANTFSAGVVSVSAGVATLVHGNNIASVSRTGAGIVRVTLTTGMASTSYDANLSVGGTTPLITSVNIISVTIFDCYFVDHTGAAADPTAFGFSVVQA